MKNNMQSFTLVNCEITEIGDIVSFYIEFQVLHLRPFVSCCGSYGQKIEVVKFCNSKNVSA